MKSFSLTSMAARLTLGFGIILSMLLGMTLLSLVHIGSLTSALEVITVHNAERAQTINEMKHQLASYVQNLGDLGSTDLEGGPAVLKRIRAALADYKTTQSKLTPMLPPDPAVQTVFDEVKKAAQAAMELQAIADKQAEGRGEAAQAFQMRGEYRDNTSTWSSKQQAWSKAVDQLSN